MEEQETLTISDGVLIVSSTAPMGGNIHRGLKNDSIWVPQISLIKSNNKKLFFGGHFLKKEGLPSYVNNPDGSFGGGIWYGFKEHLLDLTAVSYVFIPGEIENLKLLERKIHNIANGFAPDEKDSIQNPEPVGIFAMEDLAYAFSSSSFGVNSRVEDIPKFIYYFLNGIKENAFGYDCEHSGSVGLNSKLKGNLNLNAQNIYEIKAAIGYDFKKRLEAKVLSE